MPYKPIGNLQKRWFWYVLVVEGKGPSTNVVTTHWVSIKGIVNDMAWAKYSFKYLDPLGNVEPDNRIRVELMGGVLGHKSFAICNYQALFSTFSLRVRFAYGHQS